MTDKTGDEHAAVFMEGHNDSVKVDNDDGEHAVGHVEVPAPEEQTGNETRAQRETAQGFEAPFENESSGVKRSSTDFEEPNQKKAKTDTSDEEGKIETPDHHQHHHQQQQEDPQKESSSPINDDHQASKEGASKPPPSTPSNQQIGTGPSAPQGGMSAQHPMQYPNQMMGGMFPGQYPPPAMHGYGGYGYPPGYPGPPMGQQPGMPAPQPSGSPPSNQQQQQQEQQQHQQQQEQQQHHHHHHQQQEEQHPGGYYGQPGSGEGMQQPMGTPPGAQGPPNRHHGPPSGGYQQMPMHMQMPGMHMVPYGPPGMFFPQYPPMPGTPMMNPMMAQQFGGGPVHNPSAGGGRSGGPQQQGYMPAPPPRSSGTPLALSCDDEQLSEYQMLVRKQLEVFEAQPEDVESNTQGRKKQVILGQVGLRCRHCAGFPLRQRGRGAVYYPARLQGVYQAAQNMASSHLCESCQCIPPQLKQELRTLRDRRDTASGGKQYWADGARAMGLVETEEGLRLRRPDGAQSPP